MVNLSKQAFLSYDITDKPSTNNANRKQCLLHISEMARNIKGSITNNSINHQMIIDGHKAQELCFIVLPLGDSWLLALIYARKGVAAMDFHERISHDLDKCLKL